VTVLQSILLGIVQGLTEFLPISSSGHLVVVPYILGWEFPAEEAFLFDVLVQVATLVAVFAYFWADLLSIGRALLKGIRLRDLSSDSEARLGWQILLATIPAGLIGLAFKSQVELAFQSPVATAIFLFGTAVLLLIAEYAGKRTKELSDLDWKDVLWIGTFQALAILPGVSRSGSTIAGGMTRNLERSPAARFSFLISIPIMLVAGLLASVDLLRAPNTLSLLPVYIPGFIAAGVTGYFAIRWLLGYLKTHPLYIFSIYCLVVGILTLVIAYAQG
jgi:undecaprenyl-diphosphatase